jgi:hypothetical protein
MRDSVVGNGPDLRADWGEEVDGLSTWLRRLKQEGEAKARLAMAPGGDGIHAETALVQYESSSGPGPMHRHGPSQEVPGRGDEEVEVGEKGKGSWCP